MKFENQKLPDLCTCTVAVVGLGYVGLPLAIELGKVQKCLCTDKALKRRVIGFDINEKRIEEISSGFDRTNEISSKEFELATMVEYSSDINDLISADVFIITVPTPVDNCNTPNLSILKKATSTVGLALKSKKKSLNYASNKLNSIIIYESTVFPGATEEICVPILEKESELKLNKDFF